MQDISEFEQTVTEWLDQKVEMCPIDESKKESFYKQRAYFIENIANELNEDLKPMCEDWLERHGDDRFSEFEEELEEEEEEEEEEEDEDECETRTNNHSANVEKIASLDSRILEAIITILEPHTNQGDRP